MPGKAAAGVRNDATPFRICTDLTRSLLPIPFCTLVRRIGFC